MEHAWLKSIPKMLLQAASIIQDDKLLPLRVPPSTFLFLRRLGRQCDDSKKPLAQFLLPITSSELAEEIVRAVLPVEFNDLRTELDRLQIEKENAVANQEWERARVLRDDADALKERFRTEGQQHVIEIQSDHILQAIRRLGFEQAITA